MTGKRRIDRVLDPTLPERAGDLDTAELRTLRDDGREEEARLSYLRRLLHARLDIARAEVERRGSDGAELLGRLPQILSGHGGGSGQARSLRVFDPAGDTPGRRWDDRMLDEAVMSRLPDLPADELEALILRLAERERLVSAQRAQLLGHLELLQEEIVARYRDGRATVAEILPGDGEAGSA